MIRGAFLATLVVLTGFGLSNARSNSAPDRSAQQPKSDPPAKSDSKGQVSLTGCVDEQEGHWVLVNGQTMAVIANLAANGFPEEAFAKHVGHTVKLRGISSPGGSHPMFKVRAIETIRETCASR